MWCIGAAVKKTKERFPHLDEDELKELRNDLKVVCKEVEAVVDQLNNENLENEPREENGIIIPPFALYHAVSQFIRRLDALPPTFFHAEVIAKIFPISLITGLKISEDAYGFYLHDFRFAFHYELEVLYLCQLEQYHLQVLDYQLGLDNNRIAEIYHWLYPKDQHLFYQEISNCNYPNALSLIRKLTPPLSQPTLERHLSQHSFFKRKHDEMGKGKKTRTTQDDIVLKRAYSQESTPF